MRGYVYIFMAALFLIFPTVAKRYEGHTGKMLVAFKMVPGNYFENAVAYVSEHRVMGATAFVLGKRLDEEVVRGLGIVPQALFSDDVEVPFFEGGPVGNKEQFYVLEHVVGDEDTPAWQVYDFAHIPNEHKDGLIRDVISSYENTVDVPKYVLFLGYTGWAPIQLDYEVSRGSWLVLDKFEGSLSEAFFLSSDSVWLNAFKKASKKAEKKLGKIY